MPRGRSGKEHIRIVQKSRGSYHISIPIRLMRALKWQERQKVVVKQFGSKRIIIKDWTKSSRK